MTRSAAFALSFAGATITVWVIARIQEAELAGGDAVIAWNVSLATLLTCFAAFITAALIAHLHLEGMSRGRRIAWRMGAITLAIAAAALATQLAVITAAGYIVFVLAADVRRRRQPQREELA